MNSKQRLLTAVDHKTTDRIPITFDAEPEVYENLYSAWNLSDKKSLFDKLNVDTWMVLPKNFIYPEDQFALEEKTSIWGYKTKYVPYTGGAYDELYFSPLAGKDSIDEIKNHPWPADDIQGYAHYPAESSEYSDRAILGVFTWGAYFIATHVRGIENLLMDFAMRPHYAEFLINTIADKIAIYLETMLSQYGKGIDIVFMADDYCSQQSPFFSPNDFKHYVFPYLKRLVDMVHKYDKKFLLHVCGAVRPLIPQIIDAGVDMLEPIQTYATGMNPAELKKEYGHDLCFYGGMDLQHILCKGSPEDVENEAKRLIDILGKDGGYVFGPGHTYIQVDAPVENIEIMYQTAKTYYPF